MKIIPVNFFIFKPIIATEFKAIKNIENDKTDIQLRTDNVEYWATRLKEKWNARGPVLRPWGSHYLYLRDPDGLHIIIYQEKAK